MKTDIAVTGLLTFALLSGSLQGAESTDASWPMFRGNSLQTGVASCSLPDRLQPRWTFKAKDSIDGPASIAEGKVFVGSLDEQLYALDLETGKVKWSFKAAPFKVCPSYHAGLVYAGDTDGNLHCLEAATGKERWKFDAGAEITSAPAFSDETILFGAGDEALRCLSADGRLLWKFKVAGGPVLGSPAVVGGRTFVSGCDSTLHVLECTSGRELAALDLEGQTASSAAVVQDDLYVGTMSNQVIAVNWKKPEIAWRFEPARRAKAFYASVAATDRLIIAGSRDKNVYGVERTTGKQAWSFPTGGNVDGSPVVVGRRVYVGSLDGSLYVLNVENGSEVQKLELGTGISATPAVVTDHLVIGTQDGVLYCFGKKQG